MPYGGHSAGPCSGPAPIPWVWLGLIILACIVEPGQGTPTSEADLAAKVDTVQRVVESVQGSLLTSVRLIQDQLDQLGQGPWARIEARLNALETSMTAIEGHVKHVRERAHVWDTLQHHAKAWADLMRTLDSKVDHLGRSQAEQLRAHSDQLTNLRDNLQGGLSHVQGRLKKVEAVVTASHRPENEFTSRGVLATLHALEDRMRNLSNKSPIGNTPECAQPFSCAACQTISSALVEWAGRLESLEETIQHSTALDPMASEALLDVEPVADVGSGLCSTIKLADSTAMRVMRRMNVPFKRIHQRLDALDTMERRFASLALGVEANQASAMLEVEGKFNDFFNMTLEMFEHQHHQVEDQSHQLAALTQCCRGVNSDLSGLQATLASPLDRLDSFMRVQDGTSEQRLREQMRLDMNRILSVLRDHETLLIPPNCQKEAGHLPSTDSGPHSESNPPNPVPSSETQPEGRPPEEPSTARIHGCDNSSTPEGDRAESGVYQIENPVYESDRWGNRRLCDHVTSSGGWTVIQRRGQYGRARVNFTRSWLDYRGGFGDLRGEFWLGNDVISELTTTRTMELAVVLEDFEGNLVWAHYRDFRVSDESDHYRLHIGGYSGNATDSLSTHNGYAFSTVDRNHDEAPKCCPCAPAYGGGWWFHSCFESNLNGQYFEQPLDNDYYRGIIWELWRGDYSLKGARMMVRPQRGTEHAPWSLVPTDP